MIKINVLLNNSRWKDRLKNPQIYLEKKVKRLNLNNGLYKKKIFFLHFYCPEITKLKN